MAKTTAERQKIYRQSRYAAGDGGERRLNCFIAAPAFSALGRLARHQGTSKRAVIEALIRAADDANERALRSNNDHWNRYFEV